MALRVLARLVRMTLRVLARLVRMALRVLARLVVHDGRRQVRRVMPADEMDRLDAVQTRRGEEVRSADRRDPDRVGGASIATGAYEGERAGGQPAEGQQQLRGRVQDVRGDRRAG